MRRDGSDHPEVYVLSHMSISEPPLQAGRRGYVPCLRLLLVVWVESFRKDVFPLRGRDSDATPPGKRTFA